MVNFVPAVAYHFCLALPAAFTQPGALLLAEPCRSIDFRPSSARLMPSKQETLGLKGQNQKTLLPQWNFTRLLRKSSDGEMEKGNWPDGFWVSRPHSLSSLACTFGDPKKRRKGKLRHSDGANYSIVICESITRSLSHLRTMLPKSSSRPLPAQRPNHAT